jgi:tRNA(Ile)-lysidine synthase
MKALEVLDRVEAAIRKHRMFSHGDRVGVAVSGGRDSVCLLDMLARLAPRWKWTLAVLHVNHRLRPESEEEEAFVRSLASRYACEFLADRPELAGGNLEEAAREARLRFFGSAGCSRVATGHTRDDQAETVLFRILRGAGCTGLAGIRPVTDLLARPLLGISRAEVAAWVAENALEFREDSSNSESKFARNRIRHELLPQLEREWNPRLTEILAGIATVAALEDNFLDCQLPHVATQTDGSVVLHWDAIHALDPALRPRLIRKSIRMVKGDLTRIDLAHVVKALDLRPGHDRTILPGVDVFRSFDWLRFSAYPGVADEDRNWSLEAAPGFDREIPGGHRVSIELRGSRHDYNEDVIRVASGGAPLVLRSWRPGDRFQIAGRQEPARLKELFQEFRIPLWERRNWPVLESPRGIVWSGEFGAAAASAESDLVVRFRRGALSYRPLVNLFQALKRP